MTNPWLKSFGVSVCLVAWIVGSAWAAGGTNKDGADDADAEHSPDIILPRGGSTEDRNAPYYFYRGRTYGSEALVHPLRLIINGGYGIMQIDNRDNQISSVDYRNGWRNLWKNLGDPGAAIQVNGWRDFFEREIIPVSVNSNKAHYWPNYMQHLIGGGMSYRMYVEWYRYHGYPSPKSMSVATMAVYHLLNEVVENDTYQGWTTDPIADLYVFDPLGIVLFSSDRVSRFFGETLHMADWSYQPSIDFSDGRLENNGQNFSMKLDLPWFDHWRLFYHYGTHGEGGLSYRFDNGESLSAAAGLRAKDLIDLAGGIKTVDLAVSSGIFYDRDNSLLASLLFARTKDYRVRFNVYPGWLGFRGFSPGFFVADGRETGPVFGVTMNFPTTLPFGFAGGL